MVLIPVVLSALKPDSHIYVGNFESFSGFNSLNIVFLLAALVCFIYLAKYKEW